MIYPDDLKKGDVIGITASSKGILKKIDKYESALTHFTSEGYSVLETPNVRTGGKVAGKPEERWEELKSLILNKDVKMINIAAGGDYLYDMIPYVDFDLFKDNIKWLGGSSDPTSLLYILTTKHDIATIYTPCNVAGFSMKRLHESLKNYFSIIKGVIPKQMMFERYESKEDESKDGYNINKKNEYFKNKDDINEEGIIIGGCIEVIKDIIGTKYDYTKEFINRHKDSKIIWYFDVFAMSPEELHNTLLQFKYAGFFDNTNLILLGKVKYTESLDTDYLEVIDKVLNDKTYIYRFDIGHVKPSFTIINGSYAKVISNKEENSLVMEKK